MHMKPITIFRNTNKFKGEKHMVKPGFPQVLEIMENLENHKKSPCMEK